MYDMAQKAGFDGPSSMTIAAIAEAESNGNPNAIHRNSDGSTDYGVLQINSVHFGHGASEQIAKDPQSAFNYAYKLSKGGTNFSDWSTFNDDTYVHFMPNHNAFQAYDVTKSYKDPFNFGVDPSTGKSFKTSNSMSDPYKSVSTPNTSSKSSKSSNSNDGYNLADDASKAFKEYLGSYGDTAKGISSGWGGFNDLTNLPMRLVKMVLGVICLVGAFMIIIEPTVADIATATTGIKIPEDATSKPKVSKEGKIIVK